MELLTVKSFVKYFVDKIHVFNFSNLKSTKNKKSSLMKLFTAFVKYIKTNS